MSTLKIRKASLSDLDVLIELSAALQVHIEKSNPLLWRKTEMWWKQWRHKLEELLADENSRILIAEIKGEVVGCVFGTVNYQTEYVPNVVGTISRLYVQEVFRRQHIGSRLVRELCQFLMTKNAREISLRYVMGNTEAEDFWKKLGFKPIITITNSK
ncbi:MAG: GNAT family N-acetyltransferase, partial [Planctomycetota bacterium]